MKPKPDYVPEPLISEPELSLRSGEPMNISSIQIHKNVFIPFTILVGCLVVGCIYWSWAILAGAVIGWLFGMLWAIEEVSMLEQEDDGINSEEYIVNLLSDEEN